MVVFFDIDDTIFNHTDAIRLAAISMFKKYHRDIPIKNEEDFAILWRKLTRRYNAMFLDGMLSFEDHQRIRIREAFSKQFTDQEADRLFDVYEHFYRGRWSIFSDVIPCLNGLNAHKLGIISNGHSRYQREKLHVLSIADRFNVILISQDIGITKPNPAIFHEACRMADAELGESYYVGDRLETDAKAANAAGIHGVWLNRDQLAGDAPGVIVISELSQLMSTIPG